MTHGVELTALTTRRLLRLYADILTELLARGVVRSRNAPAGDLAEVLVTRAYDGELAPASEKSWDVRTPEGRLLPVKVRLIATGDRRSHNSSPLRSWDFDACVFLLLDAHTYDIASAVEVPVDSVRGMARETEWVRGFRIGTRAAPLAAPGAVDRTLLLRDAIDALDASR